MKSKGSKYHPARISGAQKRIRERIVNQETKIKRPFDVIDITKPDTYKQ